MAKIGEIKRTRNQRIGGLFLIFCLSIFCAVLPFLSFSISSEFIYDKNTYLLAIPDFTASAIHQEVTNLDLSKYSSISNFLFYFRVINIYFLYVSISLSTLLYIRYRIGRNFISKIGKLDSWSRVVAFLLVPSLFTWGIYQAFFTSDFVNIDSSAAIIGTARDGLWWLTGSVYSAMAPLTLPLIIAYISILLRGTARQQS